MLYSLVMLTVNERYGLELGDRLRVLRREYEDAAAAADLAMGAFAGLLGQIRRERLYLLAGYRGFRTYLAAVLPGVAPSTVYWMMERCGVGVGVESGAVVGDDDAPRLLAEAEARLARKSSGGKA